jgi:tetratricopeptide (TPR) repeat protein
LPAAARRDYVFRRPHDGAHAARLAAWEKALAGAATGKLIDVHRAFEQLTHDAPEDPAAWYNLGLTRAWLGDNARALEALDRYVALEPDETRAAAAWDLGEVLRFGHGMEDQADYVEHFVIYSIRNPQTLFGFLQKWEEERRLVGVNVQQEEGIVTGMVLDRGTGLITAGALPQSAKLGAYLMIAGGLIRLWHTNADSLERVRQEFQERAGAAVAEPRGGRGPAAFTDVFAESITFLPRAVTEQEFEKTVQEQLQRYFEDVWIHRPLRSLGGVPPVDASGHGTLRKKLLGAIQFLQECARTGPGAYDFDRLRRRLGLSTAPAQEAGARTPSAAPRDVHSMGSAELAGLAVDSLSDETLEQAYQAAQSLDAPELAGRFAQALVSRPPRAERPDRYSWYAHLVQLALNENNTDQALQRLAEGEKADAEQNEGRRRNDYELRRGQILARRGDAAAASEAFDRLIERAPDQVRFRGSAAEAMLGLKDGARALRFAEGGLAKSREQNNRESEDYFKELVAAAKKQGG